MAVRPTSSRFRPLHLVAACARERGNAYGTEISAGSSRDPRLSRRRRRAGKAGAGSGRNTMTKKVLAGGGTTGHVNLRRPHWNFVHAGMTSLLLEHSQGLEATLVPAAGVESW